MDVSKLLAAGVKIRPVVEEALKIRSETGNPNENLRFTIYDLRFDALKTRFILSDPCSSIINRKS